MTLGNMRDLGVGRLIASCLNDACRHAALIDVWNYPAETEILYFSSRVFCTKVRQPGKQRSMCGRTGRNSRRRKV
jgi:hypothetical protein